MKSASDGLSRRLRDARLARDMTMDELADKAKISQAAISGLERGRSHPQTNTVERLAKALKVDPCWLAYGTGTVPDWHDKERKPSA